MLCSAVTFWKLFFFTHFSADWMSELHQSPAGEQDGGHDLWNQRFPATMYYQRGADKCVFVCVVFQRFCKRTVNLTCYSLSLPFSLPLIHHRWATWAACWSGWTVSLAARTTPVTTLQLWWQRAESCTPPPSSTSLAGTPSYTAAWAACHLCGRHSTTPNGSMVQ